MVAMGNMASVLSMKASDVKSKSLEKKENASKDDFKKILDKSLKSNDKSIKNNKIKNNEQAKSKKFDENSHEKTNVKESNVNEKPAVLKKGNEEVTIQELSQDEKKLLEEIATKLDIDVEKLVEVLNVLNIDLNALKEFENIDMAVLSIKDTLKIHLNEQSINNNLELKQETNKGNELNSEQKVEKDTKSKVETQNIKTVQSNENQKTDTVKVDDNLKQTENSEKTVNETTKTLQSEAEVSKQLSDKQVNQKNNSSNNFSKINFEKTMTQNKVNLSNDGLDTNIGENNLSQDSSQTNQQDSEGESKEQLPSFLKNIKVINQKLTANQTELNVDEQNIIQNQNFSSQFSKLNSIKTNLTQNIVQRENVFNQIVENAKLVLKDNQTEMQMNLKPESLGKLSLKIASENGLIVAKITAESEQVKAIIESNLGQLKDSLQDQGLNIQNLSVSVDQNSRESQSKFMNNKSKSKRTIISNTNSVNVSEQYADKQIMNNPYTISNSSVDFVA